MTDTAYLKQNDTSPTLDAILTDASGSPVDVTGASVRFHMKPFRQDTLKIDADATIVDGEAGHVRYTLQTGDTDTPGSYKAEYEVTFLDGTIETFKNTPDQLRVVITPELG
jgi:hypothetical protein